MVSCLFAVLYTSGLSMRLVVGLSAVDFFAEY